MVLGTAIAIACCPAAVKLFGEERAVFFREAASGHNKLAYFLVSINYFFKFVVLF